MNNLDREKYDITVQTLFDGGINRKHLKPNIPYNYMFKKIFRGNIHIFKFFTPKFLFRKMIKDEYDIIVSYLEGPTTRIVSGCTNKNTKLIAWVHTEMRELKEFTSSYRNLKEMEETYKKYHSIVFVANSTKDNFEEKTKINSGNNLVVRNTIDIQNILESSKEDVELKKEHIVLATLARLVKSKGYDRLLKIHKRLLKEGIKNELWILGEGEERENIEKYINQNQLRNTVKLLGYQDNPYKYLNKADIYVCSSYIEGYSTAVTEALIIGKPIITTSCSGMDEILENGKYGLIVENDDEKLYEGLKQIILDESLRKKLQELAQERRSYFDIKNQVKQVEDLFEI